jgi:hypothetical protein
MALGSTQHLREKSNGIMYGKAIPLQALTGPEVEVEFEVEVEVPRV